METTDSFFWLFAMASISPKTEARRWRYHVYLSFRGKGKFASGIYDALRDERIKTFMDYRDTSGNASYSTLSVGPAPRAMFRSLKTLSVYDCELLQSLFASDVAQCLFQLEDLLVERCPLLERVMEAVNKDKTVLPNLKNLVLYNLPMLYGPSATTVDIECPLLERLVVEDWPQLPFSTSSDPFQSFESRNQFSFSTSASDYYWNAWWWRIGPSFHFQPLPIPSNPLKAGTNFHFQPTLVTILAARTQSNSMIRNCTDYYFKDHSVSKSEVSQMAG